MKADGGVGFEKKRSVRRSNAKLVNTYTNEPSTLSTFRIFR